MTRTLHFSFSVSVSFLVSAVSPPPPRFDSSSQKSSPPPKEPGSTSRDTAFLAALCRHQCRSTASVNTPGPVRSSVSRLALFEKVV